VITYSSMTVNEAVDGIMRRVSQLQTRTNLDLKTVWSYLNNARREVFARTLPLKEYAYIKSFAVTNGAALPADFDRKVIVTLKDPADTEYVEAREVAPKEWWTLTNGLRPHARNAASRHYPVYTIWGPTWASANDLTDDKVHIYVSPSNVTGFIEYYAVYSDLPLDGSNEPDMAATLNIPYEFENLVIHSTLIRCYAKMAERELLADTYRRVQQEYAKLGMLYTATNQTEAVNQAALVNPEPMPPPQTSFAQQAQQQ